MSTNYYTAIKTFIIETVHAATYNVVSYIISA